MKKINLGILSSSYPSKENPMTGIIVYTYATILQKKGYNVSIFTQNKSSNLIHHPNIKIYQYGNKLTNEPLALLNIFNPFKLFIALKLIFSGKKEVLDFCTQHKIDFCFAFWAIPSGYYALYAKKKLNIPYAVFCLGSDIHTWANYPILHSIIKHVLKKANILFSDGFNLINKIKKITKKECHFLSTTTIMNKNIKFKKYPQQKCTSFLFAGRLEKVKGIDILLKSIPMVLPHVEKKVSFYILGDGSLFKYSQNLVKKNKISKYVHFKGEVPLKKVYTYMKQCCCLIIPSRKESIPLVFSEALHYKMPLIVSDTPSSDMASLVQTYKIGCIFSNNNPQDLAIKIITLANEQFHYSMEGQKKLLHLFNPKKMIDQHLTPFITTNYHRQDQQKIINKDKL